MSSNNINLKSKILNLKSSEGGAIAVYLVVVILSTMFIIGFALSSIIIDELKMVREVGFSAPSYYAAESGIERALYQTREACEPPAAACSIYNSGSGGDLGETLSNGAAYTVNWDGKTTIISIGEYQGTTRRIEVNW